MDRIEIVTEQDAENQLLRLSGQAAKKDLALEFRLR